MSESILDGPEGQPQDPPPQDPPQDPEPWFYAEDRPGEGERPEWLQPHHKTVEAQAQNYVELEKKLGAFTGAPDDYTLENWVTEEMGEVDLDPDDPLLKTVLPIFKELNMSQDGVDKVGQAFVAMQIAQQQEAEAAFKQGMESLGANGSQRIQAVTSYLRSNLDETMFEGLKGALTTADAFQAVEHLIQKGRQQPLPTDTTPKPSLSKAEVDAMWHKTDENGNRLVHIDPEYRERVRKLRAQHTGTEPYIEVVGSR